MLKVLRKLLRLTSLQVGGIGLRAAEEPN